MTATRSNGACTTYNVFRSTTGAIGDFTYVGGTGVRKITDETAPSGFPLLVYRIQAVRSTQVGPWASFNVVFGVGSTGSTMIASVTPVATPKMAA